MALILDNFKNLIGTKFDEGEVVNCFERTNKEIIVSRGITENKDYVAYEDSDGSTMYMMLTDGKDKILDVIVF